ncbi:DNA/RNA helicase domain-containing protein [Leifsonia aquatica]|uniref:DNA/RNA helicase domain-containing protein n=1 Tax=Leifsonia aquatica TaxID=144185 RepID=UPI00382EB7E6
MTSFDIVPLLRTEPSGDTGDARLLNWPVVYVMDDSSSVYVGETLSATSRMRQHNADRSKDSLGSVRVILHDEFNKSVCLDLESFLIRMFAGDGTFEVLNRNEGVTDAQYFDRERYQADFNVIFESLRSRGLFERTIPQIENSDLFKFSPFKALTTDQAVAVENIVEGLLHDYRMPRGKPIVIQGDPGTGKTIVAIYLIKLLRDIGEGRGTLEPDEDSRFSDFFVPENQELLERSTVGLVVPQQSLRRTLERVFKRVPGLKEVRVLTPFQVGTSETKFDLLIVDEAHRLNHRANQPAGPLNALFPRINEKLFGRDDYEFTQLDWILAQSHHQVLLVDGEQSVRPSDLPSAAVRKLISEAKNGHQFYRLHSQLRVKAGDDYTAYIRTVLRGGSPAPRAFGGYDLRFFDDLATMREEVLARDAEAGLSRMVAGYAWEWQSRKNPDAFDIEFDGVALRWNSTQTDWINSPGSLDEVGSIHTVQGYDLNYAGVIIGPDLRYEPGRGIWFDRTSYFDKKGMEDNRKRGIRYSDDDILEYVKNIYGVLLTRGIRGTYVYVCDSGLREYLRPYFGGTRA